MFYRTLHSYILRELLRVFVLTAASLTTLMAFGGMFRPVMREGVDVSQLMTILLNLMPAMLAYAIPIAALFAAVLVYWRMSTDNELTACRAGGVSFVSIVAPAFMLGIVVASVDLVFVNYVVPRFLQATERAVMRDLGSLIVNQISRNEKFEWPGKLVVSADTAELLPKDPEKPNESVVVLHGMAANWLDNSRANGGSVAAVAQLATLRITDLPRENSAEISFELVNFTGFDPANPFHHAQGTFKSATLNPFLPDGRPFRVPSYMRSKPKFFNLRDLMRLEVNPYLFPDVADTINQLEIETNYQTIARRLQEWWTAASNGGKDPVQFRLPASAGGERFATVRATALELDPNANPELSLKFKGPVRVDQTVRQVSGRNETTTTFMADEAPITLSGNRADLLLQGNVKRFVNNRPIATDDTDISDLILDPRLTDIVALSSDDNDAARNQLYLASLQSTQPKVRDLAQKTTIRIQKLNQTILSEVNSRASFSVSCLTLVLLGAALGILLRGKNPLAVFVVGFVPAIILVLLITAGRQVTEGDVRNQTAGLTLIWAGNGILLLLVAAVYAKLLRR